MHEAHKVLADPFVVRFALLRILMLGLSSRQTKNRLALSAETIVMWAIQESNL